MPFSFAEPAPEIPLTRAPVVRAICQVRFAPVPELVDDDTERILARALEQVYPVRGTVEGVSVPIFSGLPQPKAERFRTFEDADGIWKVTVASDFLALETTTGYSSRDDFVDRMAHALRAISETRRPPKVTRVGVRYLDRIESPDHLRELVNPALLGWLPHIDQDEILEHQAIQGQLADAESGAKVLVRSLLLPANALFDPTVPAVATPSWVLDIDAFREAGSAFEPDEMSRVVRHLAERAYQVFYWAVTDQFRREFGAAQGEGV